MKNNCMADRNQFSLDYNVPEITVVVFYYYTINVNMLYSTEGPLKNKKNCDQLKVFSPIIRTIRTLVL